MILITRDSGRIARRAAELLAGQGHRLHLATRNPEHAPTYAKAETVHGDFADRASLQDAFAGVTAALVVSGSGEPGQRARLHQNAFEAAAHAQVQHVVYLSLQRSVPDSPYPFSRDHYLSEQYLSPRACRARCSGTRFIWTCSWNSSALTEWCAGRRSKGEALSFRGKTRHGRRQPWCCRSRAEFTT